MRAIEQRVSKLEAVAEHSNSSCPVFLQGPGKAQAFLLDVTRDCPECHQRALALEDDVALSDFDEVSAYLWAVIGECPPCRIRAAQLVEKQA